MRKKIKKKLKKDKDIHGLAKIANITTKSFSSVLSNYKKKKNLKKSEILS